MGRFGGDLALTMGTFGGVYIAGGIVPRFLEFLKRLASVVALKIKAALKIMYTVFRSI